MTTSIFDEELDTSWPAGGMIVKHLAVFDAKLGGELQDCLSKIAARLL